jgi:hypothetical protein
MSPECRVVVTWILLFILVFNFFGGVLCGFLITQNLTSKFWSIRCTWAFLITNSFIARVYLLYIQHIYSPFYGFLTTKFDKLWPINRFIPQALGGHELFYSQTFSLHGSTGWLLNPWYKLYERQIYIIFITGQIGWCIGHSLPSYELALGRNLFDHLDQHIQRLSSS